AVYQVVSTFVSVMNQFYAPKRFSFTVQEGISIFDKRGAPLEPQLLSSGERQLLTLFCTTVLARDQAALFLIDEPELSLNIKWQRKLVDALLECSANSTIQYL